MSNELLTYREYQRRLDVMADIIEDRYEEEEDLHDVIFEEVDSSSMVLYTSEALDVLRVSDSQPQEWKHMVGDDASWQEAIQTMAFTALRADLSEKLRQRDIDV